MARTRSLGGEAQAAHVLPASLRMGGDAGLTLDPGSDLVPGPDAPFLRGSLKGLEQDVLKLGREERSSARIVAAGIAKTSKAVLVVALNESANPSVAQANDRSSMLGGVSLSNQPECLEASRISGGDRRLIVLGEFIDGEVRCQMYSSCHRGSIYQYFV